MTNFKTSPTLVDRATAYGKEFGTEKRKVTHTYTDDPIGQGTELF